MGAFDKDAAVLVHRLLVGLGSIVGHVRRQRRLAHRRPSREDQQVRAVKPAQHRIQLAKAGGHADDVAVALKRFLGTLQRQLGGIDDGEIAAFSIARRGEIEQLLFGAFDLVGGRGIDLGCVGVVDHVLADID